MPRGKSKGAMKVVKVDDDTGEETPIGTVSVGTGHKLTLVRAAAGRKKYLAGIVKEMNGKDRIHLEVAPPAGAPRFANASRIVERNDGEFLGAMKGYLREYHGIVLL